MTLGRRPTENSRDLAINFRGVPSGLLLSQAIFPGKPMTRLTAEQVEVG